jgi:hypothetical protein
LQKVTRGNDAKGGPMDVRVPLYFITEIAGFVMVVGGMWLIYKQKIYIDKESNEPLEIKLPGNLSFKSNYPALALFALGFFPLIYPFHQLSQLQEYPRVVNVKLTGVPHTNAYPALVFASTAPSAVTQDGDSFTMPVPFIGTSEEDYKVLLVVNDHILDTQTAKITGDGTIEVQFRPTIITKPVYKTVNTPIPPGYK